MLLVVLLFALISGARYKTSGFVADATQAEPLNALEGITYLFLNDQWVLLPTSYLANSRPDSKSTLILSTLKRLEYNLKD